MALDWNPAKRVANVTKHGFDFQDLSDFEWQTALVEADTRRHYGEVRLIAIGLIGSCVFVVVYTIRRTATWIIGLRKANKKEVLQYAAQDRDPHR